MKEIVPHIAETKRLHLAHMHIIVLLISKVIWSTTSLDIQPDLGCRGRQLVEYQSFDI